ncbi:hypothetical protein ACHAXA_006217 [Cyclostephanos tholiformis]|uniref:GOLD domain-containing protein n=1 Tax=Cyclostephanos tholiformis TaxID=382380 RepID=A0ABD3R0T5_9STRA
MATKVWEFTAILAMAFVALSAADPMILITNSQPKCMFVDAPADVILNIQYEAPDLVMPADLEKEGTGVDPRSFRRFRTTITIYPYDNGENHHGRHGHNRDPRAQQEKFITDLNAKKGNVEYITKQDGQVSICVQSLTASAINPTPISLRVTESAAGEESVGPGKEATSDVAPGQQLDSESQRNAKVHFSQMEKTLSSLISKTDMILKQADYAKELEVEFHEQSIAMNKASQWWPILQLSVLLITGFTQANHMIQFFRKHHIF